MIELEIKNQVGIRVISTESLGIVLSVIWKKTLAAFDFCAGLWFAITMTLFIKDIFFLSFNAKPFWHHLITDKSRTLGFKRNPKISDIVPVVPETVDGFLSAEKLPEWWNGNTARTVAGRCTRIRTRLPRSSWHASVVRTLYVLTAICCSVVGPFRSRCATRRTRTRDRKTPVSSPRKRTGTYLQVCRESSITCIGTLLYNIAVRLG